MGQGGEELSEQGSVLAVEEEVRQQGGRARVVLDSLVALAELGACRLSEGQVKSGRRVRSSGTDGMKQRFWRGL